MGLVREQTARYWIWTRLDDYPAPGYTTSVHVSEEEGGWVITDLVVSRSPVHLPGDSTVEDVPWLSNGVITNGRNEAGVTPAVLKDLRISEIRGRRTRTVRQLRRSRPANSSSHSFGSSQSILSAGIPSCQRSPDKSTFGIVV